MRRLLIACSVLGLVTGSALGADRAAYEHFFRHVQPLLSSKCLACHSTENVNGGLRLDKAGILEGGDSGPAVIPGDPEHSLLIQAVKHAHEELSMPPKEKLKVEQIDVLALWVKQGAVWPAKPLVLFEDETDIVSALDQGKADVRLVTDQPYSGKAAIAISAHDKLSNREKFSERITGWKYAIREQPREGEYRYLRFAWKKSGGGCAMLEVANDGRWPEMTVAAGRYVAGPNSTGVAAVSLSPEAPSQWTTVTVDLWKDLRDFSLTGLSLVTSEGGEARFDQILLGPSIESLDAYIPGHAQYAFRTTAPKKRIGDAWTDPENPIVKIFGGQRLDLWSLVPPKRPDLPAVKNASWTRNAIDHFVLAAMERRGVTPAAEADRRTLIRRVTFDLIGLPPSPDEVQAFVLDNRADAYERLVDRLLASRHYGEHWARRWLDVARYSDTNGFERDEYRSDAFRYRDYVIRSLNDDKPYDQFITEQLAGDELVGQAAVDDAAAQKLLATGFLRMGPFDTAAAIFEEDEKGRDQWMADMVNTTASAFLGLTMSCCRCHDHKYDPLSQADHFRLQAFFAGAVPRDQVIVDTSAEQERIKAHNATFDAPIKAVQDEIQSLLAPVRTRLADERRAAFPADVRELLKSEPAKRSKETVAKLKPFLAKLEVNDADAIKALNAEQKKAHDRLIAELTVLRRQRRAVATALGVVPRDDGPAPTFVLAQGDYQKPLAQVQPGFLSVYDPNEVDFSAIAAASNSNQTPGRRTTLARWITAPENPFTARVIVNRLWQYHFGRGIVATPNDFGVSGQRPSHPELLDWLATEMVRGGWSLKGMHRQMVLSAAYRQATEASTGALAIDPENQLYTRQMPRRLEAETLRDAMLAVAGKLLPTEAGPPVWPPLPPEVINAQPKVTERPEEGWYTFAEEATYTRTIFTVQKRSIALPMLEAFDLPDSNTSCGRRNVTTVAPQALMMFNGPLGIAMSRGLAERALKDAGGDSGETVRRIFRLALARDPDAEELTDSLALIERHTHLHRERFTSEKAAADTLAANAREAAITDLCRAVLNTNEFLYVD